MQKNGTEVPDDKQIREILEGKDQQEEEEVDAATTGDESGSVATEAGMTQDQQVATVEKLLEKQEEIDGLKETLESLQAELQNAQKLISEANEQVQIASLKSKQADSMKDKVRF